jgi:methylated-DNA-[protein]-cysteine S-methyltransferase
MSFYITGFQSKTLGKFWALSTEVGLCRTGFGITREAFLRKVSKKLPPNNALESHFPYPVIKQVEGYLSGSRREFSLPLDWRGMSTFQTAVYKAVLEVPYGRTKTYGEIAAQLGRPNAARAVGAANAANPLPLIIPCHRLVGADGALKGYGSGRGISTKAWLLNLEEKHRLSHT